jgi:hypothetical protein
MPAPPPELSILAETDEPRSIRSLAQRSQGNYRAFLRAAHDLASAGAIHLEPKGRELLATATSSRLTGLANDLLGPNAHRGLPDVFRSDRPQMLLVLHSAHQVDLAADVMGKSPGAVRHMIRLLQPKGLVIKERFGYRIHPHHQALIELLQELDRLRAEARLRHLAPRARLVWHLGPEMLIQTDDPPEDAQLAGLDAFRQYAIDIQTRGPPLYYLGNRTLTAADAILQALVATRYKTPDGMTTPKDSVLVGPEFNYAGLLWEKEKPQDIWGKADLYFGGEHQARDVVEYVHEKGDWAGFLPWAEHERLRKLYGLT